MRATVHRRHKRQPTTKSNIVRPFIRWHFLGAVNRNRITWKLVVKTSTCPTDKYKTPQEFIRERAIRQSLSLLTLSNPFRSSAMATQSDIVSVFLRDVQYANAHHLFLYIYTNESQLNPHT